MSLTQVSRWMTKTPWRLKLKTYKPENKVEPAKDNRRFSMFQLSGQDKEEPSAVALQVPAQKSREQERFAKDNYDSMEMQMIWKHSFQ